MSTTENHKGDTHTAQSQTKGSKQVKIEHLASIGTAASVGPAPADRVYTKDYSKVQEKDHDNNVSLYLGNPLRW